MRPFYTCRISRNPFLFSNSSVTVSRDPSSSQTAKPLPSAAQPVALAPPQPARRGHRRRPPNLRRGPCLPWRHHLVGRPRRALGTRGAASGRCAASSRNGSRAAPAGGRRRPCPPRRTARYRRRARAAAHRPRRALVHVYRGLQQYVASRSCSKQYNVPT